MKGVKDPGMLADLLPRGRPLVTTDRALVSEHTAHIPPAHPGIIVIFDDSSSTTITLRPIESILGVLKAAFPGWAEIDFHNSILWLSPRRVQVSHVESRQLVDDWSATIGDSEWAESLRAVLDSNAHRDPEIQ